MTHMSETNPQVTDPAKLPNMYSDVSRVDVTFLSQTKSNYNIRKLL